MYNIHRSKRIPIAAWACVLIVAGNVRQADAAIVTLTNAASISIPTSGAGSPYPLTIVVSGLPDHVVTNVVVQLQGFEHSFPDDVDVMLVSPSGHNILLMSDVGGSENATSLVFTISDSAVASLPDGGVLTSGTYRPTNIGAPDAFAAPAPAPSPAASLSALAGSPARGTWSLYVTDDTGGDLGAFTNGWTLQLMTATNPLPAHVVISEFRVRGPTGANDEYVELYNNSDYPVVVTNTDGSAGWSVAATNGLRFVIPNGTIIPARGHFLGVNSGSYSLGSYPAGPGAAATGNVTFATDIPDNAGIALFRTANPANYDLARRMDAVGSSSETNTLYKEGAGYPALTPFSIDYAFVRNFTSGEAQDTGTNRADFIFVDSNGTSAGAGQRLGAPGPENLSSPGRLHAGPFTVLNAPVDAEASVGSPPNRSRDYTSDPANNSTFGTLSLRRKIINNSAAPITRLRFRVVDLTTFPAPSSIADLRPRTSTNIVVSLSTGGTVVVSGLVLEQPPSQPNGGGFNSTLTVSGITTNSPLNPGGTTNVQFLLGIQQTINIRFAILTETTPPLATEPLLVVGETDLAWSDESDGGDIFRKITKTDNTLVAEFSSSLVRNYQLQTSSNALAASPTWLDLGGTITGRYTSLSVTNVGGAAATSRIYRVVARP
ncbi:MAG: lamin tail domain-containing protein [Kiritimatiellae bacterium]|nr:lamin tail domain-containing protein [Kiritimatiellia bacterium]